MGASLALREHSQFSELSHGTQRRDANLALLIDRWRLHRLELRRLLLQLLSGELLTFPAPEQRQALRALCAELVDYAGTGHFEIYGRVLPRRLRPDAELHALLVHIFHSIGKSTDAVLSFNDQHQHGSAAVASSAFRRSLLRLSRGLLLRFALEEQLLELCGH